MMLVGGGADPCFLCILSVGGARLGQHVRSWERIGGKSGLVPVVGSSWGSTAMLVGDGKVAWGAWALQGRWAMAGP
jgi:hypothetical protein